MTKEKKEIPKKAYSPIFGTGLLIHEIAKSDSDLDRAWVRFEVDGEVKVRFRWMVAGIGKPDYALSTKGDPKTDDPDSFHWTTFKTWYEDVLCFRRGGPPPPAGEYEKLPHPEYEYGSLSKKGKALYDAVEGPEQGELGL